MSAQQNSFPYRILSASIDSEKENVLGYNMTPTTVLYSKPIVLAGQTDFSIMVSWTGSDGNPPNASGSFQVCNVSGTNGTPISFGGQVWSQPYCPVDTWTDYALTGALGAVTSFPINGKSGFQPIEIKDCPWHLVRLKITPSGAGSGSAFADSWIKGRG